MRIFILSDPPNVHTKRWVSSLAERGFDIFLFGLRKETTNYYSRYSNITVYSHHFELKNRVKDGALEKIKYLRVIKELKKCIKDFNPDILHAHYASSYGLLGALSGFHPYIISVWGSDVYDFPKVSFLYKSILKYNLLKADKILSTSHIMAVETQKYTNKSIFITPFGVDTELFKKQKVKNEKDKIVIGTVKTLTPKYGIDVLIKAFKIVIDRNPTKRLVLKIVGEGEDKEKLMNLTKNLRISDKVEFCGKIENKLLPEVYNSFLVAVFLSVYDSESFGVVAVEAMSCECPVVASDADGFTEVVEDGRTGFIVPKRNYELAAIAIQKFIDNPELREELGKNGRERVEKLYLWNKNVDTMVNIYNSVI